MSLHDRLPNFGLNTPKIAAGSLRLRESIDRLRPRAASSNREYGRRLVVLSGNRERCLAPRCDPGAEGPGRIAALQLNGNELSGAPA